MLRQVVQKLPSLHKVHLERVREALNLISILKDMVHDNDNLGVCTVAFVARSVDRSESHIVAATQRKLQAYCRRNLFLLQMRDNLSFLDSNDQSSNQEASGMPGRLLMLDVQLYPLLLVAISHLPPRNKLGAVWRLEYDC